MNNNNIKKTWVKVCFKVDLYKSECAFLQSYQCWNVV